MRGPFRTLLALLVVLCASLSPVRALAWTEKGVQSSTVTLQIAADGTAVVQHEIGLGLRGERFKSFTLPGIDADARLVGSATAIRTDGERPAGERPAEPLVLESSITGEGLVLRVPLKNGAVGRTFLLRFAYRTDLLARGLLRAQPGGGGKVELHWSGPRFEDGVDSATLLVRTAPGVTAPEVPMDSAPVPSDTNDGSGNTATHSNYGTVVSTLRRSNTSDEVELVRPHTAKNEAVHWRLNLDAGLFELAPASDSSVATTPSEPATASASLRSSAGQTRARGLAWAALLGIVYALLVALKSHWTTRAAQLGGCHARALIDLPRSLRIGLAGLCFAIAATLVMVWEAPVLAALALIAAMLLGAQRSPELDPTLRGPGEWRPLGADAFELKPAAPVPGAWLDAGRAPGFVLLALLLCGWGFVAASLYTASPYEGACALLASAALLPLFCTGRQRDLPLDPLRYGKVFFKRLSKRLTKKGEVSSTPLGRFAQASGEVDELRLALQPDKSLPGLLGFEVALEFHHGIGGAGATPVVLLRAADGSPCYRALPRELVWTRGRTSEERVSLIEPRLPTLAVCEALVRELLVLLAAPQETAPNERKNSARSSGNALSTVKAATRPSPAQAT